MGRHIFQSHGVYGYTYPMYRCSARSSSREPTVTLLLDELWIGGPLREEGTFKSPWDWTYWLINVCLDLFSDI